MGRGGFIRTSLQDIFRSVYLTLKSQNFSRVALYLRESGARKRADPDLFCSPCVFFPVINKKTFRRIEPILIQ